MEFLQFIFSSFWVWLGATTTVWGAVGIVIGGIVKLVKVCKPEKRRVQTFRNADILRVDIVGASIEEAREMTETVVTATYDGYGYKLDEAKKSDEKEG